MSRPILINIENLKSLSYLNLGHKMKNNGRMSKVNSVTLQRATGTGIFGGGADERLNSKLAWSSVFG